MKSIGRCSGLSSFGPNKGESFQEAAVCANYDGAREKKASGVASDLFSTGINQGKQSTCFLFIPRADRMILLRSNSES